MFVARNLYQPLPVLLTLTYPSSFPTDGAKVKRDWACMRKWLTRRGLGGLMVLEFQERGAPHLHAYISGEVAKEAVRSAWYAIVGSCDPKHLQAGTRIEALRKPHALLMYVLKYAGKMKQKIVPPEYDNVGRFWSLFGGVQVKPHEQLHGDRASMAPVVRLVRNLVNTRRAAAGVPPRRDKGRWGFWAWDVGPAMAVWCGRVGLAEYA
jgi:hypothetical protein